MRGINRRAPAAGGGATRGPVEGLKSPSTGETIPSIIRYTYIEDIETVFTVQYQIIRDEDGTSFGMRFSSTLSEPINGTGLCNVITRYYILVCLDFLIGTAIAAIFQL